MNRESVARVWFEFEHPECRWEEANDWWRRRAYAFADQMHDEPGFLGRLGRLFLTLAGGVWKLRERMARWHRQ